MRILTVVLVVLVIGCVNSLSKFENIQTSRTRPLAVVLEPAEASPGDTVHVRYFGYSPDSTNLSMHWTAALDFSTSIYGGAATESHIVNLDGMMLPGHRSDDFYFVVPDSTLLFSTYLKGLRNAPWNKDSLSIEQADAVLKAAASSGKPPPADLQAIADMIGVKIKIMVHINAETQVDVFKYMTVRYSRRLHSVNVNTNPSTRWIALCAVDKAKLMSFDSVQRYPDTLQYLFYPNHPELIRDTVQIDSGKSYFVVCDSGIEGTDTAMQRYSYRSLINGATFTARENYNYQWFYKDVDYRSPMQFDSLIVFQGGNERGNAIGFLPPVDTAMHRFKFYLVLRDARLDFEASGESEFEVNGYFTYSPRYARNPHM